MSIFDTIMSALRSLAGGGTEESTASSGSAGSQSEGKVSVEHDPDAERATPNASTEAAVKGTDPDAEDGDAAAAGTDASASNGTLVDEETGKEPAEAVGTPGGDADGSADEDDAGSDESDAADEAATDDVAAEAVDAETTDTADEAGADEAESDEAGADEAESDETETGSAADGATESVETIRGIGPAYAGRLSEFGIETVGELAGADAAAVAEGIDVSESRVRDWIERANDAS